jgi:hypothetical protein
MTTKVKMFSSMTTSTSPGLSTMLVEGLLEHPFVPGDTGSFAYMIMLFQGVSEMGALTFCFFG